MHNITLSGFVMFLNFIFYNNLIPSGLLLVKAWKADIIVEPFNNTIFNPEGVEFLKIRFICLNQFNAIDSKNSVFISQQINYVPMWLKTHFVFTMANKNIYICIE